MTLEALIYKGCSATGIGERGARWGRFKELALEDFFQKVGEKTIPIYFYSRAEKLKQPHLVPL